MTRTIVTLSILPLLALAFLITTNVASADQGTGWGPNKAHQYQGMKGGMQLGGNGLVPTEMKQEWRSEHKDMSQEQRREHMEERQEYREENRESLEDFTGLTREEVRNIHHEGGSVGEALEDNGVTEEDMEEFLTERAEERLERMAEHRDLDEDEKDTLRERIQSFVDRMLSRWF